MNKKMLSIFIIGLFILISAISCNKKPVEPLKKRFETYLDEKNMNFQQFGLTPGANESGTTAYKITLIIKEKLSEWIKIDHITNRMKEVENSFYDFTREEGIREDFEVYVVYRFGSVEYLYYQGEFFLPYNFNTLKLIAERYPDEDSPHDVRMIDDEVEYLKSIGYIYINSQGEDDTMNLKPEYSLEKSGDIFSLIENPVSPQ